MALIQMVRAIKVNDKVSIPVNGEIDINVEEYMNFIINTGTIRIIDSVTNHHDFFHVDSVRVMAKGSRISIIILRLRTLYLIRVCEIF